MNKAKIKEFLHSIGVYNTIRKLIIKIYYPYKNYKIKSNAKDILERVGRVFESNSLDYWLDYGTLLGYIREGKIIKGDLDLDFGVIMQDSSKSLKDDLKKEQIYITQQTFVDGILTTEQYKYKDIGFDIFYYRKEGDKFITNIWLPNDYSMPQKVSYKNANGKLYETTFSAFGTKKINFYGVAFNIPKDSDNYLKEHYGDDYMIPNPNFSHKDEKNIKAVKKDFKVIFYE